MRRVGLSLGVVLLALVSIGFFGCSGQSSPTGPSVVTTTSTTTTSIPEPTYTVGDFVTGVKSSDGVNGTQQSESTPASSGGPSFTPSGSSSIINGGSTVVRVQASTPFQVIYIAIANVSRTVIGYWRLQLNAPTLDTYIVISYSKTIPTTSLDTLVGVSTAAGLNSAFVALPMQVLAAATGDVQVSVSWNAPSDVDLYVKEPSGEQIYWNHTSSATGGRLDLDSNADCNIDNKDNENIRWTTAPSGSFTVAVDYYKNCGVSETRYVVTVNNGGSSSIYTGTFTGAGTLAKAPTTITSFAHGAALSIGEAISPMPALFVPPEKRTKR